MDFSQSQLKFLCTGYYIMHHYPKKFKTKQKHKNTILVVCLPKCFQINTYCISVVMTSSTFSQHHIDTLFKLPLIHYIYNSQSSLFTWDCRLTRPGWNRPKSCAYYFMWGGVIILCRWNSSKAVWQWNTPSCLW